MDLAALSWVRCVVLCAISVMGMSIPIGAAPPGLDPCTLVTTAEVEAVLSKLKGPPRGETLADAKSCTYEFTNGQDEFEIWIGTGEVFARMRKDAKNPVTVSGFGEEAYMDRGRLGLGSLELTMRKGAVLAQLSIREGVGDEAKLKALAQKAAGRM
ncbi:MAG: hypothetical protein JNN16_14625 [Nitrospira sp.]|nr:hypothetical protein [Nitrospira sp.]